MITCSQCDQKVAFRKGPMGLKIVDKHRAPCGRYCFGGAGAPKACHRANACLVCAYRAHRSTCTELELGCGRCASLRRMMGVREQQQAMTKAPPVKEPT